MTKGRSTKLWITLLDPEIRNGEPRLVQVWRLYKDLPGSRRAPSSRPRYPPIRRRAPTTPPTPSTSPACGRATPPRRSRCAPRSAAPPAGSRASGRAWCSLSSPPRTAATGEPTSATERGLMPSRLRSPRSASPRLSLIPPRRTRRRPHLGRARTHEATRRASTRGPEVRLPHPSQAPMSRSQEARAGAAWPFRYSSSPPRG